MRRFKFVAVLLACAMGFGVAWPAWAIIGPGSCVQSWSSVSEVLSGEAGASPRVASSELAVQEAESGDAAPRSTASDDASSEAETYSKDIADAINRFLVKEDWNFSLDKEKGVFAFGLNLKSKIKTAHYFVAITNNAYIVYACSAVGADKDDSRMMGAMAEFICRANYGLMNGNFELDMRDGEIRYKSFVDCAGGVPSEKVIENSIYVPAALLERYAPGILDIIFNDANASDAIAKCE